MTDKPQIPPLKPCPFCGRCLALIEYIAGHTRPHVICGDELECGTEGPYADNEAAAIAAWNTRAGDANDEARTLEERRIMDGWRNNE